MTQIEPLPPVDQTVTTAKDNAESTENYDRYLEGTHRVSAYDLLESRGNVSKTTDPDVQRYLEAKALFRKGYDLCFTIPRSLEDEELEKHVDDVKASATMMVNAWLLDDKAALMSERVLILGQQFEKVLLKDIPESEREGFFVKESLLFSAWILLVGRQYDHCQTTLTLALDTYTDLPPRVYLLRALCYFYLGKRKDYERGILDLKKCLQLDEKMSVAYSMLGAVHLSLDKRKDATRYFKQYLEQGHPDSADTINAYYALSVLRSNNTADLKHYYEKAVEAEKHFKDLYGTETGMSDTKRRAIILNEFPEVARRLIKDSTPSKEYNAQMEELIRAGILSTRFPPTPNHCFNCGETKRKDDPDKPLWCCGACRGIWYCSQECQKADYKASHKQNCRKSVQA